MFLQRSLSDIVKIEVIPYPKKTKRGELPCATDGCLHPIYYSFKKSKDFHLFISFYVLFKVVVLFS